MLCIMYVRAWMHVCTPGACRGLRRPDAAAWELQELELQMVLRHRTGRWEPSLGPLRKQYAILSAEPCLQPWGIMIYGHGEAHFWVSASGAPEWRWRGTMRNDSCLHTVPLLSVIRVTPNSTTSLPPRNTIRHALLLINNEKSCWVFISHNAL